MARFVLCLMVFGALLATGCGDDGESKSGTTSTAAAKDQEQEANKDGGKVTLSGSGAAKRADEYAKQQSGGITEGCLAAGSGASAEQDPGCIYSAAFAGCLEGISGEAVGGGIKEFPEPGLEQRYRAATRACS